MSLRGRHPAPYISSSYDGDTHYLGKDSRILQRERTSQVLVDRAKQLNNDFLLTLANPAAGNILKAAEAKALLKEHIQTITMAVTNLSRDIETLESQMMMRDHSHNQASHSVKNLEYHHIGSISELRSRVGRCDASIAKLSTQMRGLHESIANASKQVQDLSKNLSETVMETSTKVLRLQSSIEKFEVQQDSKLRSVEGGSNQAVSLLDSKTRALIETVHKSVQSNQLVSVQEQQHLKEVLMTELGNAATKLKLQQKESDKRQSEHILKLQSKIENLETVVHQQQEEIQNLQSLETRVNSQLRNNNKRLLQSLEERTKQMQKENFEGFKTLQQSMATMQSVLDGKRRLLAEEVRKEMGKVKKLVVLT
ncbi:uncharacterized protein [Antedon mediterranea]|uniref:uncharacterized protein n=1 Tax=Antedon mediterranea TaxID=105859 RepID=UPI003AF6A443